MSRLKRIRVWQFTHEQQESDHIISNIQDDGLKKTQYQYIRSYIARSTTKDIVPTTMWNPRKEPRLLDIHLSFGMLQRSVFGITSSAVCSRIENCVSPTHLPALQLANKRQAGLLKVASTCKPDATLRPTPGCSVLYHSNHKTKS